MEDFGGDISDTIKKKSILSDVAERSNGKPGIFMKILDVFLWFQSMIIIFPTSQYSRLNQMVEDEAIRELFSRVLKCFDTGIESVESKIITTRMMQNHGNDRELFDYQDESDGTQRLFELMFYRITEGDECQIIATTHDSRVFLSVEGNETEKEYFDGVSKQENICLT